MKPLIQYALNRIEDLQKRHSETSDYYELLKIQGALDELRQLRTFITHANILTRETETLVSAKNLINRPTGESQDHTGSPIP